MTRTMTLRACLCLLCSVGLVGLAAGQPPRSSLESALETIFNPRRAPGAKTMGLVQRNFLDLIEVSRAKLQVAIVVDGTDSMSEELDGIRRSLRLMVDDLHRYNDRVSFQLVVFRDEGARSRTIAYPLGIPQHAFTSDAARLQAAIEKIQPESGAPYYPELIDLGIHEALTKLDWSDDEDTSRWLLVFGDAPPFDEGFEEEGTKASRRFATTQLIATANRLGININCVLCPSRSEDREIHDEVLTKTRQFMSRLTSGTGGLMLDLSYPDIREAIDRAAQAPRVTYQKIGKISREAIDRERQQAEQQKTLLAENRRSRIAVLPHMPLDELSFDTSLESVQVSAELRHRLRAIPGAELKSPLAVERHAAILKARGVRGTQLRQSLANALNVDYLVWGSASREQGNLEIRSAFYDRVTDELIVSEMVRGNAELPVTELTGRLADSIRRQVVETVPNVKLAAAFGGVTPGSTNHGRLTNAVAQGPAHKDLLAGLDDLEKALAYPAGDNQADQLLKQARATIERARNADPQNPFAHWLLAQACFGQAQALIRQGKQTEATGHLQAFRQALSLAHRFRQEAKFGYLRREIEADYTLLIAKDFPAAVKAYEELAKVSPDSPLKSALQAHWMLVGLYCGDWGVADAPEGRSLINEAKAREHIIKIGAHWSDSKEAEFFRHILRWDDDTGVNQFDQLPRVNEAAAKGVVST